MIALETSSLLSLAVLSFAAASLALALLYSLGGRMIRSTVETARPLVPLRPAVLSAPDPGPEPEPLPAVTRHDLDALRTALAHSPALIWRRDRHHNIDWVSDTYRDAVARLRPEHADDWPVYDLFSEQLPPGTTGLPGHRRAAIPRDTGDKAWFELSCTVTADGTWFSAVPIDATIRAEDSLRAYMATLTRTFAQLQTGLAIFDRRRQLILFNPAFHDLTGLDTLWLSTRPTLAGLLDRMHDRHALPEPRDYRAWRDRLAGLEAGVQDGGFEEVWTLPSGRVFRICAQPHHDGGLALLMDDISDDVALTRQFRSEIDLAQSVIDALPDAVAVFTRTGTMVLANEAYGALWGIPRPDPRDTGNEALTISGAIRLWQSRCLPGGPWQDVRDSVTSAADRSEWSDSARRPDGRLIECRVQPLSPTATLVAFTESEPTPVFQALRRERLSA